MSGCVVNGSPSADQLFLRVVTDVGEEFCRFGTLDGWLLMPTSKSHSKHLISEREGVINQPKGPEITAVCRLE